MGKLAEEYRKAVIEQTEQGMLPFAERHCLGCDGEGRVSGDKCDRCHGTGRLTAAFTHYRASGFCRLVTITPVQICQDASFLAWMTGTCSNCNGTTLVDSHEVWAGEAVIRKKDCGCVIGCCGCATCVDARKP